MQRLTLIALALAALVWPGAGQAKELSSFKACGAAGCKAVTAPATLRALIKALELQGEPVTTDTPAPAPFFRLEFTAKGDERMTPSFTQYYVPSGGVIAIHPEAGSWAWIEVAALRSLYREVTAGQTPYGKPTFTRAALGGDALAAPASYSRLFTLHQSTDDVPAESDWIPITFGAAAPSPWTTEAATLEYSPSKNVLWRGVEYVKLPGRLASNLEHGRSLAGAGSSSGGGFPWVPLLASLGGALVLVAAALSFCRRRSEPAPITS